MAAGHSNYQRGAMPVDEQSGTFKGFMGLTVYGGAIIALVVIMPTLVYGVGLGWPAALLVTVIVGLVIGAALKLKAAWFAGVIAASIPTALICAFIAAVM